VEVLQAASRGMANKEIADALGISTYTVQVHLRNVFGKLGVDNRTEAVTYALAQGWIKLK
jgi:DNA-binding NarL/FixJ family response regulator